MTDASAIRVRGVSKSFGSTHALSDIDLDALVAAWDAEVALLASTPPDRAELERAQRRLATENLDQLKDPHALMRRLLVYAGLGDWRLLGEWTDRLSEVRPLQVMNVARRHLVAHRRLIGYYRRGEDGG